MKNSSLSQIEIIVEGMVEGTFGRLFGGRLEPLDVANGLVRAIEDSEEEGEFSLQFTVLLNNDDLRALSIENPNLASDLATAATKIGWKMGINQVSSPDIRLIADPKLRKRQFKIFVTGSDTNHRHDEITQAYLPNTKIKDDLTAIQEVDAFLIVQGRRHIPLDKPVLSIGRRTENDIVLDRPSVSRQHAQIRWRFGTFVLYDVSYRGNTLVNGDSCSEHVLRSGDVISLGDVMLVYGEGFTKKGEKRSPGSEDDDTLTRSTMKL